MRKNIFLLILIVFLYCGVGSAQQEDKLFPLKPKVEVKITNCHENNSELSILTQYTDENDLITINSHLGMDEKINYGQRRLHNAETFLTKSFNSECNRPVESILIAEGKRVKGKGHLDFFVKGKLDLRIFFNKNQDFNVPPCISTPEEKPCSTDFEKLFYPCKSKK